MPAPILATKFYIPLPRPNIVPRPRLIERLNEGLPGKLTLISAPAGFGKTTLVSSWIYDLRPVPGVFTIDDLQTEATSQEKVVNPKSKIVNRAIWLSLDEGDNDPICFLTYFVAAVQTLAPHIGVGVMATLQTPQPPPVESLLTTLLNEITGLPYQFILVLDDYHVVEAQAVDQVLTFLLKHLPPQLHLVIATREDPRLPLARLRARGQLTELRAADLRFTPAEAADFLNQVMGLNLSTEDIAALETRTEGWIAGLQLAALSMQGQQDTAGFIKLFTGSNRFVLDYLVEEVLQRQSAGIQTFLLRTSILDRLCGPLCDAVLGKDDVREARLKDEKNLNSEVSAFSSQPSAFILEYLERANLFIVPLDNERRWYRYHHLFAGFLRQRLQQGVISSTGDEGGNVAELHIRASRWYEENGYEAEAFHHAIAAGNFERAAALAELAWQAMDNSFQSATWLSWVKKLPDKLFRARPVLSTQYAQALMDAGEPAASEARLRDAERWLASSSDGMVVADKEQFRTLPATIAIVRAYNAQVQGDIAATIKYAELALKLTPEEDHFRRAQATITLEFTHWASGELEAAYQAMADWVNSMLKAGNMVFAVASAFAQADLRVTQGHLHEAINILQQSIQFASAHGQDAQRVTAHHHLGLAMIYHEMDDTEAADHYRQKSHELGQQTPLVDWPNRWCLAQAQWRESAGDFEAALGLLDEAARVYVKVPVPDIRPIAALKARVYIKQGDLTRALAWARECGLSVDDDLSYLREFEHMTLARVLIAEYQSNHAERSMLQAIGLLERLLQAAEAGQRLGSALEILVLQALAHQAQGHLPLALASLERALTLAEPEGYVRIFVDEGAPIESLLKRLKAENETLRVQEYVRKLLAAFGQRKNVHPLAPSPQPLLEPLSQRELEVLQLIAQGLSNHEISARLFLALDTVKGHTRRIFGKLQVNRRTEAVARARELGLL